MRGRVEILHGDALATLRTLPADSFQCCVTSPPYYALRSYLPAGHPDKHLEMGSEETPQAFIERMVDLFREVRRVLHPTATLWLNIGDSYASANGGAQGKNGERATRGFTGRIAIDKRKNDLGAKPKDLLGIPWMLAFALRADGWWLRSDIIWAKPNPMPESVTDRPTKAHEYVFLLTKSDRYFYDAEAIKEEFQTDPKERYEQRARITGRGQQGYAGARGQDRDKSGGFPPPAGGKRNARSVWEIVPQPFMDAHFATMPLDLAKRCILAGTSEVGACPQCQAPWERVLRRKAYGDFGIKGDAAEVGQKRNGLGGAKEWREYQPPETVAWRATCRHRLARPVPQRVLDPFGGAGTTGLAAHTLDRHATLVELHPDYVRMAQDRIYPPLLAMAAAQ